MLPSSASVPLLFKSKFWKLELEIVVFPSKFNVANPVACELMMEEFPFNVISLYVVNTESITYNKSRSYIKKKIKPKINITSKDTLTVPSLGTCKLKYSSNFIEAPCKVSSPPCLM